MRLRSVALICLPVALAAAFPAACGGTPVAAPDRPPTVTATGGGTATGTGSAGPAVASRPVTMPTADGAVLAGRLYGTGPTAVVLSNMGDNDPQPWDGFAPLLAARGYTVLTYAYRYPQRTSAFTATMARDAVTDLRAAIEFVRRGGATRLVLMGASLGGIIAAKVAAAAGAACVVLLASRLDLAEFDLRVTAAELGAISAPKLVIASEADATTAYALTREVFDRAPEPKRFKSYPGGAHGVRLFATEHGDDLRRSLLDFVAANAPA